MDGEQLEEYKIEVQRAYDEYLYNTEGRGISYGEIAYIEGLNEQELNDLYNEINEQEK